jgi:hypothetical protein
MLTSNRSSQQGGLFSFLDPDMALNLVEGFCGIFSRPIDIMLRLWHGSRYFSVAGIFFCNLLMILLPLFGAVTTGVISMIPLVHMPVPTGFGIGSFSELYFAVSLFHGIRIYRLMIHPHTEQFSQWEGEPLPFIYLVPKSNSFWCQRIIIEPALVILLSIALGHLFIITNGLAAFLQISAMALAMKNFCGWYRAWQQLRDMLDMAFAGPIMAKLVDNSATEKDLSPLHIATLPKDLPEEMRRNTALHIARAFTPEGNQA